MTTKIIAQFKDNYDKLQASLKNNYDKLQNFTQKNERRCAGCFSRIISSLSLNVQVVGFYFIIIVLFFMFFNIYRFLLLTVELDSITNNHYHKTYIKQVLLPQLDLKFHVDEINNKYQLEDIMRNLLFLKIYTNELINKDIATIKQDKFDFPNSTYTTNLNQEINRTKFSELNGKNDEGLNFDLMYSIGNIHLVTPDNVTSTLDPNFITPLIWQITPLFYQYLDLVGMKLESNYFIAYDINNCNSDDGISSNMKTYFKYPISNSELSPKSEIISNSKPFDIVLDPFSKCFKDLEVNVETRDKFLKLNWFSNYETIFEATNETYYTKVYRFNKINELGKVRNYKIVSSAFSLKLNNNNQHFIFAFVNKFDLDKSELLYKSFNNSIETISIYYTLPDILDRKIPLDIKDKVYLSSHNVDDNNRLVHQVPDFMNEIFSYSIKQKDFITFEDRVELNVTASAINSDLKIISTDFLKYDQNYWVSYPFSYDSMVFKMFYEMHAYMKNNFLKLTRNPKCKTTDLNAYYKQLQLYNNNDIELDCLYDICRLLDCSTIKELQPLMDNLEKSTRYLPMCNCLKLFCYDETVNMTIHPTFQPLIKYMKNLTLPNSCQLNSLRRTSTTQPLSNIVKFSYSEIYAKNSSGLISMSLNNYTISQELIDAQHVYLDNIKRIFIYGYLFLSFVFIIVFVNIMKRNVETNVTSRINQVHNFYANVVNTSLEQYVIPEQKSTILNTLEGVKANLERSPYSTRFINISSGNDNGNNSSNNNGSNGNTSENNNNVNEKVYKDELTEFKNLIFENIDIFKVDFKTDQNIYTQNKIILSLKDEIRSKQYSNLVFDSNNRVCNTKNEYSEGGSVNSDNHETASIISDNTLDNNLNIHIIYEVLSTEIVDLGKYKQNFFFRDISQNKLINMYNIIEKNLFNDESIDSDITDPEKLEKSINYFISEIHSKWMKKYEKTKPNREEKILIE